MFLASALLAASVSTAATSPALLQTDALLVEPLVEAMEAYASGTSSDALPPELRIWTEALERHGVDRTRLAERLEREATHSNHARHDRFAKYRKITLDPAPVTGSRIIRNFDPSTPSYALHLFRIDVLEDLDDAFNDDLYAFLITTYGEQIWGHVTNVYKGLDQGDAAFLVPGDREIFGPKGERLPINQGFLVDLGLVESDGDDVRELKKVSGAIVEAASLALTLEGVPARMMSLRARSEVKNLLQLVVELDHDDRIVTETLRFTGDDLAAMLPASGMTEFAKVYAGKVGLSRYRYRLSFRLVR